MMNGIWSEGETLEKSIFWVEGMQVLEPQNTDLWRTVY